jgi:NAD(P)-dependent dehydrogenase (short-subunit alcohol dehydrogenase family)
MNTLGCPESNRFQERHEGSIVNVGSLAGLLGLPTLPAYNAFKHGAVGLTNADVMQYGLEGIRINCVCPG